MSDKPVLIPNAKHPITVTAAPNRVQVRLDGELIADSTEALVLTEASYPPVYYIPRAEVRADVLTPSDHSSYCPYKGEASYHGLRGPDGALHADKAWYYPHPHPAVDAITDHLAFYPDAVSIDTGGDADPA